jgi:Rha family phage regulatory protein
MHDISIREGIEELGIFEKNGEAWVSSRDVARLFGKEHFHVMETIKGRILPDVSEEFGLSNFRLSSYKNSQNKKQPEYLLNRKSFTMVAVGFTGKKAMKFKEAYIEAFEAMRTVIDTRIISKNGYKEMTSAISRKYIDKRAYSIEADMINQIVLGMKAADFRELHRIDDGNTRDAVVLSKLEMLDKAQRLNAQLILAGLQYDQRKAIIEVNFRRIAA